MKIDERGRWVVLCSLGLLLGACESSREIGSTCARGVCPQAIEAAEQVCSVTDTSMQVQIAVGPRGDESQELRALCLPSDNAAGSPNDVSENLYWRIPQPVDDFAVEGWPNPRDCNDAPFLSPAQDEGPGVCLLHALTAAEREAGRDGWFYDETESDPCPSGPQHVAFTPGATPTNGTLIEVRCLSAHDQGGDGGVSDVSTAECSTLPDGDGRGVGNACTPQLVDRGYDPREHVLELGSSECSTGVCLVYELDGDPSPDCTSTSDHACASEQDVEDSVYCSCRCNVPEGDADVCRCPGGFTCASLFEDASEDLRGGYCVRSSTIVAR